MWQHWHLEMHYVQVNAQGHMTEAQKTKNWKEIIWSDSPEHLFFKTTERIMSTYCTMVLAWGGLLMVATRSMLECTSWSHKMLIWRHHVTWQTARSVLCLLLQPVCDTLLLLLLCFWSVQLLRFTEAITCCFNRSSHFSNKRFSYSKINCELFSVLVSPSAKWTLNKYLLLATLAAWL